MAADPLSALSVRLSKPAVVFLRAAVRHMNQRKILPEGNAEALTTSAWLEEIEAAASDALDQERAK